ncbi:hypothetical protein Kpol_1069p4 [Vanderwaltozyma polyspora DSM 70294]|uniref:Fatty acid hydroxylase domain-containing protein n=1 Tax=Vanderwaltozyma polyspora (strain ATCC 22028 / DSM 70294 / BCRC 21397 / CBS 2163 / NBRC 10782 / NRRL Y-8283 / UCD 57-17) TaxID=436907 RepID=A7TRB4_VANPO|nr:uncharacterized protein Kpol_1069p4 [Vanderwaltozyma polyspora DSM 70294]EDO15182.1 hypothetical protein Kpol_1069p4 [Vanderwaltozyma polyspora DSM 70294]
MKIEESIETYIHIRKTTLTEEKLKVTTDYNKDFNENGFLKLDEPLFWQLLSSNFTRDFYIDQVHKPRHYGIESAPIFGNFLEPFTKTHWFMVPLIWGPVVLYNFIVSLREISIILAITLFSIGVFVWTLIEYCMHRYLFHLDDSVPETRLFFVLHFLLHGIHHYLPMDKYRLVMPPALFSILCYPFYLLTFAIFPRYWAHAGFAGGLFGYVCYDVTHYFLHHKKMPSFMRKVKKYHLEHHYKNFQLGFGVTSSFWDRVFGTYLDPKTIPYARSKRTT